MQMSKFKNKQKYLINVVIHIPYNIGIYIGIWIIGSEVLRLILDLLIILAILIMFWWLQQECQVKMTYSIFYPFRDMDNQILKTNTPFSRYQTKCIIK